MWSKWEDDAETEALQRCPTPNSNYIHRPFSPSHIRGLCLRRFASNCKKQWPGCRLSCTHLLGKHQYIFGFNNTCLISAWLLGVKSFLINEPQIISTSCNIFFLDSGILIYFCHVPQVVISFLDQRAYDTTCLKFEDSERIPSLLLFFGPFPLPPKPECSWWAAQQDPGGVRPLFISSLRLASSSCWASGDLPIFHHDFKFVESTLLTSTFSFSRLLWLVALTCSAPYSY